MRALKIATVVMGVLIVLGTVGLLVALARRGATPPASSASIAPAATMAPRTPLAVTLAEPEGTRIVTVTAVQDRLAVQLQGGGPDRIVLLDPHSGAEVGRIAMAH
jgi:flagellar basal body-associated protein FliL